MTMRVPIAAALLLVLAASCSDGGVVGGHCRFEGCVEPAAEDTGTPDAGVDGGDAPSDHAALNDAVHPEADAAGSDADAGSADGEAGTTEGGDGGGEAGDAACAPPFDTPAQCGDCATQCSGATPLCALSDAGYACVPVCALPLSHCGDDCVDLETDASNCGACGNVCPSGICQSGKCVGASVGHIVLLCMSFEQNQQGSPSTALLGNAVFLPPGNPVRVLAYDEHSPAPVENKVKQALGWSAAAKGRTYTLTGASSVAAVTSQLGNQSYDVFLVYDQTQAPAGALGAAGSAWSGPLASFVQKGGVVVVASGGGGAGEMPALIAGGGLLPMSGQTNVTGQVLYNLAPWDAVGLNVLSPFLALNRTCSFATSAVPGPGVTFVVSAAADAGGAQPVVVHRVP